MVWPIDRAFWEGRASRLSLRAAKSDVPLPLEPVQSAAAKAAERAAALPKETAGLEGVPCQS